MRRREKNKKLKIRLDEWGEWINHPVKGLGFSGETTEYRMMREGNVAHDAVATSRVPRYKPSPECNEVDRAVADLPEQWRRSIYAKHTQYIKTHEIQKIVGCSVRGHYKNIECAYAYLSGRLGYVYED